ncbi:MAG: hypothetical protein WDN24_07710 [Sphingomonas sp.]
MFDWRSFGRGLMRALFSTLVAALFLLVLLVASAQQQVMNHLDSGMSYSVARKVVGDAEGARRALTAEQENHDRIGNAKRDLEHQLSDLDGQLYISTMAVQRIAEAIVQSKLCVRLDVDALPDAGAKWGAVYDCYRAGKIPKEEVDDVETLLQPGNDPTKLTEQAERVKFDLQSADMRLADSDTRLKAAQATIEKAAKASDALQIVLLLDQSFIGVFGLTYVPPALMQILLCFLSGLFGALLITLVLLVYPNNELSFSRTNSFWNRILLGGLIAVGVFVMIAGGVAVLGSSEAILNGQNNFLSFCAIGMLAGGFSDRFAKWLSDNATMLVNTSPPAGLPPPTGAAANPG